MSDLPALIRAGFGAEIPTIVGIAVSGGGDSIALLHLMAGWRADGGPDLAAVTVDHRLREGSGIEAATVAQICAGLGIPHHTLSWQWGGTGNLEAAARQARLTLISGWAKGQGIDTVALGHTADDSAETFLMRLARGSGVDGLSAMQARRIFLGVTWLRPLLTARRADLRTYLTQKRIVWSEDPMNADPAFDRVKARAALVALAPLGLTVETLTTTAHWMALARIALNDQAADPTQTGARQDQGDVVIDAALYLALPTEIQFRLFSGALRWVASNPYRPRRRALIAAHFVLAEGGKTTIAGCIVTRQGNLIRIAREHAAVASLVTPTSALWDTRWSLDGPHHPSLHIAALGEPGIRRCPDWRATGLPRASLLASPAVWRGETLIAAPLAGKSCGWTARVVADFVTFLKSD